MEGVTEGRLLMPYRPAFKISGSAGVASALISWSSRSSGGTEIPIMTARSDGESVDALLAARFRSSRRLFEAEGFKDLLDV